MNPISEALNELREYGWARCTIGEPTKPQCIRGPLIRDKATYKSACAVIYGVINEQHPEWASWAHSYDNAPQVGVMAWNDSNLRTWPEVERVMEKAAQRWEEL